MSEPQVKPNPDPVIDVQEFMNGPPAAATATNDSEGEIPSVVATLLVDCRCQLGECCIYDDRTNSIVFTSILDQSFHRLYLDGKSKLETYQLPKMLCSFGLVDNTSEDDTRNEYIVAWEDGFQLYDLVNNKPLSSMSAGENIAPLGLPDRLNDGRCDPSGTRYICGGCAASGKGPLKVYKVEYDAESKSLNHTPIIDEIQTTNSICFSQPDGKTMYIADSPTKQIHQYDYDQTTGEVTNKRLLHTKLTGVADGSVVDADGFIWNATWRQGAGTGTVDRICPQTGSVVFQVHLPDNTSEASCCCFGGPNLDILFITSAWENLDPASEPNAGGLYAVKLPKGMKGLKERRFQR